MRSNLLNKIMELFDPSKYKDEKDYIESILIEYKGKRSIYEEFCAIVHKTIEALLKEGGYRYQLTSRTKTVEGLKEKLIRKREKGVYYNSLKDIEDLSGIRVIFYTERDKEKFKKEIKSEISGLLEFEEREKNSGYYATHIVMSFGPKRIRLIEYQRFNGLKSEIQLTSILHHAWAEIEHDLIYKDVHGLKERDPQRFELMTQKMKQLMQKYIKRATEELEEIVDQH